MDADLRHRLQRLGVVQGVRHLLPATPTSARPPVSSGAAGRETGGPLPGAEISTPYGPVWVEETRYPAAHRHGAYPLGELGNLSPAVLALLGDELGPRPAFLDTETTGLAGGTGTLVFLTGVALWEGATLTLRLIFLRDPAGEPAALRYLADLLAGATSLVTFNGRGFDVPLLQTRFILNRLPPTFAMLPHLDLLAVARLLWRELALTHKRRGEWEAALALWAAWTERIPWAVEPLVERAKYAEWVAGDLAAALAATGEALARLERLPPALRGPLRAELEHRRARLLAKLAR